MSTDTLIENRRSSPRIALPLERPVYIQGILKQVEVNILVENLSIGGAMLICPELLDPLQKEAELGRFVLILPNAGQVHVNACIRWAMWPRVGIQFKDISQEESERIADFLHRTKEVHGAAPSHN